MRQILIIGSMRTGTTVFGKFLGTYSEATNLGEVFHTYVNIAPNFYHWCSRKGPIHPFGYPDIWPDYLNDVACGVAVIDIKSELLRLACDFRHDRPWPIFPLLAPGIDSVIVRITRRNKLLQIVSLNRAMKTGVWRTEGGIDPRPLPIELDSRSVVKTIDTLIDRDRQVDKMVAATQSKWPVHTLWYEDMFSDQGTFSDQAIRICADLLGPPESATPSLSKQGGAVLANEGEIRAALAGSPHEWMLHDDADGT